MFMIGPKSLPALPAGTQVIERCSDNEFPLASDHFLSSYPQRENFALAKAFFQAREEFLLKNLHCLPIIIRHRLIVYLRLQGSMTYVFGMIPKPQISRQPLQHVNLCRGERSGWVEENPRESD